MIFWLLGCIPAAIVRFLLVNRPLSKGEAWGVAIANGFFGFVLMSVLVSTPNPVSGFTWNQEAPGRVAALWGFFGYGISRHGHKSQKAKEKNHELGQAMQSDRMKPCIDLLKDLKSRGIRVKLKNGKLLFSNQDQIDPALRSRIEEQHANLISLLSKREQEKTLDA